MGNFWGKVTAGGRDGFIGLLKEPGVKAALMEMFGEHPHFNGIRGEFQNFHQRAQQQALEPLIDKLPPELGQMVKHGEISYDAAAKIAARSGASADAAQVVEGVQTQNANISRQLAPAKGGGGGGGSPGKGKSLANAGHDEVHAMTMAKLRGGRKR